MNYSRQFAKIKRGSSATMPGFLVLIVIKVLTQAQQLDLSVALFEETIPNSVARIGSFWQLQLFYWQFGCAILISRGHVQSIRLQGDYQMKNINWFKYKQYLGFAIDLGRIFPLLSKQKGLSKIFLNLYLQLVEIINVLWMLLQAIGQHINNLIVGFFPGWFYEFGIANLINIRLETAAQFVLR